MTEIAIDGGSLIIFGYAVLLVILGHMVIRERNFRRDIDMLQRSLSHARQSRDKQTCRLARIREIVDE